MIDRGLNNIREDGLLNIAKFTSITHVLRDIETYSHCRYDFPENSLLLSYFFHYKQLPL